MVTLDHECITTAQYGLDVPRDLTRVREYAKPKRTGSEYVLRRFARIVWNGKRLDAQAANRKSLIALDQINGNTVEHRFQPTPGSMRHPHRHAVASGKSRHTSDVIVMLMGYDYCRKLLGLQSKTREPAFGLGGTEPAIQHDGRVSGAHHQGVTTAAAAEAGETQRR